MTQPDDSGFVKRGFWMLGLMTVLVLVVLGIIVYRPAVAPPEPRHLPREPSSPGWQVRYNATVTLLRRGSDRVPWGNVREMLNEPQQMKNNMTALQDGREVPDEAAARATVITTLRALGEWNRHQSGRDVRPEFPDLKDVRARVDELSKSPIVELRVQADRVRETFAQ